VTYENGPFRYLNNHWRFSPLPQGCEVDFFVDFEFRSRILQMAIGVVFNEAVRLMVRAFERRAMALYGRNAAPVSPAAPAPSATG
jgi:coenzyme Q-binding protein COQ10